MQVLLLQPNLVPPPVAAKLPVSQRIQHIHRNQPIHRSQRIHPRTTKKSVMATETTEMVKEMVMEMVMEMVIAKNQNQNHQSVTDKEMVTMAMATMVTEKAMVTERTKVCFVAD